MHATDDRASEARDRRFAAGVAALFVAVLGLASADLAGDLTAGGESWHVALEAFVAGLSLFGAVSMLVQLRRLAARTLTAEERALGLARRADDLARSLEASRAEAERWRAEAAELIAGLSGAIDRQLDRWGLSAAEKEVALLLLKGLSHREIGSIRAVGEATVRQQARAVYRKAGLAGRADLAAFFLEDLLAARTPAERASV